MQAAEGGEGAPVHVVRAEIRALTGLRAVAALAVVIHHVGLPATAPDWAVNIAARGYIGVPLFFMLSGFVLAYNYPTLHFRRGWRELTRFWVARLARVMPLYLLVLLWAVSWRGFGSVPQDPTLPLHVFGLQAWFVEAPLRYNPPAWSVSVELFLYALFPLIVIPVAHIARRWGVRGLLTTAGTAFVVQVMMWAALVLNGHAELPSGAAFSTHRLLYRFPLAHVPEFVVGISLAFLLAAGVRLRSRVAHVTQGLTIAFVLVVCGAGITASALNAAMYGVLWTIPFAVLLLSLASGRGFFAAFLSRPSMVALGAASYALYLTHFRLLPAYGQAQIESADGLWAYVAVVVVVGMALLVAEGAHRYVEVPARRWIMAHTDRALGRGRHLDAHLQLTHEAAGATTPART